MDSTEDTAGTGTVDTGTMATVATVTGTDMGMVMDTRLSNLNQMVYPYFVLQLYLSPTIIVGVH